MDITITITAQELTDDDKRLIKDCLELNTDAELDEGLKNLNRQNLDY